MMTHTHILAIDPGCTGGLAELYPDGRVITHAMPDDVDLCDLIREWATAANVEGKRAVCFLELVGGFVKGNPAPGSAMFAFGDGYGFIRGLLAMANVETHLVRPQVWQAGIPGVRGAEKAQRKRALKEHAARLFPTAKPTLKTADALCIGDYARSQLAARSDRPAA